MSDSLTDHLGDPGYIIQHLSTSEQHRLNCFDEVVAFFSTPFKRLGISGWTKTGCSAGGRGSPVRDAQHSTDGFYTIDVKLITLAVASWKQTAILPRPGHFLRLEVEPGTPAHHTCFHRLPKAGDTILFQGVVLIDRDGPFYEVHPSKLWFA
jgi:hypothetical protein